MNPAGRPKTLGNVGPRGNVIASTRNFPGRQLNLSS